jgi:1,4-alpha-glucan branching enzyme
MIVDTLMKNVQKSERMPVYAENHVQCITGARSFAEALFGAYQTTFPEESLVRGVSLYKMIRSRKSKNVAFLIQ